MVQIGKPLEGMDLRELADVRPFPFLWRLALYALLVAGCIATIAATRGPAAYVTMVVLGLVYVHGVELQHQTLHNTGLRSRPWNRRAGFLLGFPMLVSFSRYQHSHLEHHRLLGTHGDREFFSTVDDDLASLGPLLAHLLMLAHYREAARAIAASLAGRLLPGVKQATALRIRAEYRWMGGAVAFVALASLVWRNDLALRAWLLPLVVANPVHALIELPEHWRRDHRSLDLRANTRTLEAGRLASWFTNGNNYHVEHHWLPAVPNDRLPEIHAKIADQVGRETYLGFYAEFLAQVYRSTFNRHARRAA